MSIQIKLKNSVVQDSTPSTSDLPAVGEIALNANINSIGGFMRASDNTIVKIFGPGSVTTPTATTTVSGIAELATNSETTTGTATNRVVTPAGLNAVTVAERSTSNSTYLALAGGTLTGVVAATAGSNSAPAINFGDSDSGIFGGTNTVSLAAGGTTRLTADTGVDITGTLAVTGAITSTSDLTIADKIIHAGDTNTAVRFPAADTVSVETGGNERFRVDSNGVMMVGLSSALSSNNAKLQVAHTDGNADIIVHRAGSNSNPPSFNFQKTRNATIGNYSTIVQDNDELGSIRWGGADGTDIAFAARIVCAVDGTPGSNDMPGRLEFKTSADGGQTPTTRLTIDSDGLVKLPDNGKFVAGTGSDLELFYTGSAGILRNTGSGDLTITCDSRIILGKTDGEKAIEINPDGNVELYFNDNKKLETTSSGVSVTGAITGTADLTIDTNTLHVDSSNNRVGIGTTTPNEELTIQAGDILVRSDVTTGSANSHAIGFSATATGGLAASISSARENANEASALTFKTWNGSATGERMRLDSSGRLLIGGTSVGSASSFYDDLVISNTTSGTGAGLTFIANATNGFSAIDFADTAAGGRGRITYSHGNDDLRIDTAGSERMRIDSSGNVGIGTSSVSQPLHLANSSGNTIFELQRTNTNITGAVGTISFTASDGHSVGSIGMLGDGDDQGGNLVFRTTSAAADNDPFNAATPERMRLDSSGKLGLGTNSPQRLLHLSSDNTVFALTDTAASTDQKTKYMLTDAGVLAFGKLNDAYDTATEYLRITNDGFVGINQSSPTCQLQIDAGASGDGTVKALELNHKGNDTNDAVKLNFARAGSDIGSIVLEKVASNNTTDFIFNTRSSNTVSESVRITGAGNLGIGITPTCGLHIDNPNNAAIAQILDTDNSAVKLVFRNNTESGNAVQIGANGSRLVFVTGANERGSFDADGRLLIGATSSFGNGTDRLMIKKGNDGGRISFGTDAGFAECIVGQLNGYWGNNKKIAAISFFGGNDTTNKDDGNIRFATSSANNLSERMRINEDGRVLINTLTVLHQSMLTIKGNGVTTITTEANLTSAFTHHIFNNPNGQVGDIRTSGNSTIYNTSSDYRLKENVVAITDGITRLKTLKPYRFNFKADKDTTVDGFFAHEVTAVPEAISGEKDAVNEDGSINPQGIDQSKLVPLLVAAVQELIGRVEKLEAA